MNDYCREEIEDEAVGNRKPVGNPFVEALNIGLAAVAPVVGSDLERAYQAVRDAAATYKAARDVWRATLAACRAELDSMEADIEDLLA